MAVNLSGLSPITTAANALSNLILVTPNVEKGFQPQSADGATAEQPPALLFHYEGEQTVALESDITDHYVEDNTAIQDQWALKPEVVTTHGFVGELNNVTPKALQLLKTIASKLTVVGAYVPVLSETALIAYNQAFMLYQTATNAANSAVSAWSSLTGKNISNQNKQQVMFQQFYGYWRSRTLFTVQTPWAIFENMAISRLRAIQDPDTKVITDFEVTFKMMRFATTKTTTGNAAILQGRAAAQAAGLVDLGTSTPPSSISMTEGLGKLGF